MQLQCFSLLTGGANCGRYLFAVVDTVAQAPDLTLYFSDVRTVFWNFKRKESTVETEFQPQN